ncbi:aldehyde dehydrogenase family protein [Blastococcus brunescens]|uniref:Aldehyde dehydrogenase family protein n=1 Tax=Blastococcus brunescens TaxID=1564165 RepID=A0ABZ1BAL7_9ACTN|nr:aldehyde dehydrogenase family protein [Blastococcus sp. BMG 8361]WRL66886.1 aldehyde dehydrogenase family protein [Blastococcus sp. BMG 8361]
MAGGNRLALGSSFFEPTVIGDVSRDALLSREETFGPVAALFRFSEEAEVMNAANDTELGLAAYVFTRDIGRAWRMAESIETGMVGINVGFMANEAVPFGGIKESGIGREGAHDGLEEYLESKYICMGGV